MPRGVVFLSADPGLMAVARGLNLVRQNRNGVDILAIAVPPTVELFDRYEPVRSGPAKAQFLYRLYSGYAHAKQWATMLGAAQQAPFDHSGRTIALTQGSDVVAVAATQRAINAVRRALDALEQLRQGPGTSESEAAVG